MNTTPSNSSGLAAVISGPSGVGKSTIVAQLLAQLPDALLSVSATTRPIRPGEIDGQNYHFLTAPQFDQWIAQGRFLEHAEYVGNRYGTPAQPVADAVHAGHVILIEIDVQGADQIHQKHPDIPKIFILAPSRDVLHQRLAGRKTETPNALAERIALAERETAFAHSSGCYQYFVTNDILTDSVQAVKDILQQERSKA